jgi:hypothetical protein
MIGSISGSRGSGRRTLWAVAASTLLWAGPAAARQAESPAWNDARVLELVERGRQRRMEPLADTALRNYRAHAEGTIYFYIDPEFDADPVLMRADQVALELYWGAPDRTRQVVLGQRMEKRLPIRNFHYYIDRLTVVQNGFGDEIQVGEGLDVRNVTHPLAPAGATQYDFLLADSLVLRLPGAPAPIRAYEVVVRPRDPSGPAFVGSIYLDGASGALVRMSFSFTRSSYVDPRNDYIRITLDHGLWRGRYWLPHEQRVVVRRELPELDLQAGTVIQAWLRVLDYEFDLDLPAGFFRGPAVMLAPRVEREAFPFRRGLYDDLREMGLGVGHDMEAIEARAREVLRGEMLRGLPRVRFAMPDASTIFRFNRVEGVRLGAGMRLAAREGTDVRLEGGYAFGSEQFSGAAAVDAHVGPRARLHLGTYGRALRDVEPGPVAPMALNTLAALFTGDDHLDPFHASGGNVRADVQLRRRLVASAGARAEWHETAVLNQPRSPISGTAFRPVFPLDEGRQIAAELGVRFSAPAGRAVRSAFGVRGEAGHFRPTGAPGGSFWRIRAEASQERSSEALDRRLEIRLSGGAGGGGDQRHRFHLGGRGSVPGHDFRAFVAPRYALAEAGVHQDVVGNLIGARAFAAAALLGTNETGRGALLSVGVGVTLLHDVLRLDLARGLGSGGSTTLMLSAGPGLRPWM